MNHWTDVRRAVLVEGISKREACRRFGVHWQTLERILAHASPPGYQRVVKTDRPVIGPWLGKLAELLEANRNLPRKQRYTVKRTCLPAGRCGRFSAGRAFPAGTPRSRTRFESSDIRPPRRCSCH